MAEVELVCTGTTGRTPVLLEEDALVDELAVVELAVIVPLKIGEGVVELWLLVSTARLLVVDTATTLDVELVADVVLGVVVCCVDVDVDIDVVAGAALELATG